MTSGVRLPGPRWPGAWPRMFLPQPLAPASGSSRFHVEHHEPRSLTPDVPTPTSGSGRFHVEHHEPVRSRPRPFDGSEVQLAPDGLGEPCKGCSRTGRSLRESGSLTGRRSRSVRSGSGWMDREALEVSGLNRRAGVPAYREARGPGRPRSGRLGYGGSQDARLRPGVASRTVPSTGILKIYIAWLSGRRRKFVQGLPAPGGASRRCRWPR